MQNYILNIQHATPKGKFHPIGGRHLAIKNFQHSTLMLNNIWI